MANEIYHRSNWGNAVNDNYWADVYEKYSATNKMYIRSDYYENSNVTDKLMADIYPKPSILLTPTAYDNGSLHSVKPVQSFGSELITNGSFDTDTNWTKVSGVTISGGKANFTNVASNSNGIYQSSVLQANKNYRVEFTISNYSSGNVTAWSGGSQQVSTNDTFNSNGTKVIEFNSGSTNGFLLISTYNEIGNFSIDNVSIKEVIDADFDFTRGSSATRVNEKGLIEDVQILSGNLVLNSDFSEEGEELIVNGDFSNWTNDNPDGWTITGTENENNYITEYQGKARYVSDGSTLFMSQNILTTGKFYKVTADIVVNSGGGMRFQLGANGTHHVFTTTQSIVLYAQQDGTDSNLQIIRQGATDFTIDNVSVKEVGQNWTFGTGWSINDGKAVKTSGTGSSLVQTLPTTTIGKKYKFTFDTIVTGGVANATLYGVAIPNFSTSGSQEHTIIATSTTGFGFFGNSFFEGSIDNVSLIEITDDTDLPRINYTNGEGSLLLEPQSTNLITYSENFSSNWGKYDINIEGGYSAPDGSDNAYKVTYNGSNAHLAAYGGININKHKSIWARTVNSTGDVYLLNRTGNNLFTLTTKWQRFEIAHSGSDFFYAVDFRGAEVTLTEVIIWGAQLEALSYATSYIPTEGSTVTRLADVCSNAGSSDLINSTEGVLYAEISALANDGTVRYISLSDGSSNNRAAILYYSSSNNIRAIVSSNGTNYMDKNYGVTSVLDFHKIALVFKENDFSLWVDGFERKTDTSGNTPIGLNNLSFDVNNVGNFNGNVKCVAVFKEALDNDQLERLTGEGYETFKLLAQANNYTII